MINGNDESSNIPQPSNVIHIEILKHPKSVFPDETIVCHVSRYLANFHALDGDKKLSTFAEPVLHDNVKMISICGVSDILSSTCQSIFMTEATMRYHVYHLNIYGPATEHIDVGTGDGEEPTAAKNWILPSSEFHELWESLVYDTEVKSQLLNFVSTSLLFSDQNVDSNVISWNKVVLLHGPPGTGKTSLCRALAHKLSIRLSHRFRCGQLIEINSHSLFSKWFSESGKLVQKMFDKIHDLIDDSNVLVCVLIDEIESLSYTRKSSISGSEPSDSMRVVNALLTQLDQLKRYSNVIVLTTSNMTDSIDLAFIDRADIKQYIGLPTASAVYQVYRSCMMELRRANIIKESTYLLDHHSLKLAAKSAHGTVSDNSFKLWNIATKSVGLSGRTLRKIPFLAHAFYVQKPSVTFEEYLNALSKAVDKQFEDANNIKRE